MRRTLLVLVVLYGACSPADEGGVTADAGSPDARGRSDAGPDDAGLADADAPPSDAGAVDGGVAPGSIRFENASPGVPDADVFVTVIGRTSPTVWSWIDADGATHALDHTATDASDHLEKNGVRFANMSFTLTEGASVALPSELTSARVYISIGAPLYIAISADDQGWAVPALTTPADPNYQTRYDWYELSYKVGEIPFVGHTTQTTQFALPLAVTLQQASSMYATSRGILQSREEVVTAFAAQAPTEFQSLIQRDTTGDVLRVLSPASAAPGGLGSYLDAAVDEFWATYATTPFAYVASGYTVTGSIGATNQFNYTITPDGGSPLAFAMAKPSTVEIFAGTGAFTGAGPQAAFLADLDAAFNRGVATSPEQWADPSAYYPASGRFNHYARFFHSLAIDNLAFGFPNDGVNAQGSQQVLPNSDPPSELVVTIRP
jgi:hypothetical protein